MRLEDTEGYDSAVLLLTKGDEIHIRTTENVTPEQFLELLMATSLALQEMFDDAEELSIKAINRMMH